MIVDDSRADARLMELALEDWALPPEVTIADSAESARELLVGAGHGSGRRPDLVFLDMNMPGRDGASFLVEIKKDVELRDIPIIVLSGSEDPMTRFFAYQFHANAFVRKPKDQAGYQDLAAAVESIWAREVSLPPAV